MKTFKQLCIAATLVFVLAVSALAGNIHTNVVDPPPPPTESATITEPGHIGAEKPTDPTQNLVESNTLITQITLSLLQLLAVV